jgi:hypothetical protein
MLSDTDGDGRMDRVDVWADNLPPAYGIVPARGGIIVACAPDIVFLADRDGDGTAEVREKLFTGFRTGALERGSMRHNGVPMAGSTLVVAGAAARSLGQSSPHQCRWPTRIPASARTAAQLNP